MEKLISIEPTLVIVDIPNLFSVQSSNLVQMVYEFSEWRSRFAVIYANDFIAPQYLPMFDNILLDAIFKMERDLNTSPMQRIINFSVERVDVRSGWKSGMDLTVESHETESVKAHKKFQPLWHLIPRVKTTVEQKKSIIKKYSATPIGTLAKVLGISESYVKRLKREVQKTRPYHRLKQ